MSAYEESLETRREKLRDLVLNEEADLTREIVEEAQRSEDARSKEARSRAEELRKRKEEEHESLVAAKRMQQYLASYPDVKQELSKRCAIDAKQCNLAQMADNEARRLAEKELDGLWRKVMLKELEMMKHREAEESERRVLARRETVSALAQQVADRLALEEERKRMEKSEQEHLERLWEDVRQAELRNLETERQKREILKREFEEQILLAKRRLAERAREEAEADRAYKAMAEEELAEEKARAKGNTAALRMELLAYLKYLEDLRREEVKRQLEVEAIVRQSREDVDARRELALRKFKEARQRAMRQVLRGREEQLRAKREAGEEERRLKAEEREALERQIEMDANLTAMEQKESRQRVLRYGLELKKQQNYVETMRRCELEEDRRHHRAEIKRQAEEYQRLTNVLLNASENITPHPFKVLLKECAARHAAERKGRCYCPPALTSV
nr:PREDICTED: trichoplein keratin filament-binding protein-like [Linepithema humile]